MLVTCPLCEKTFKRISVSHLLKKHKISMIEFREQFPTVLLTSDETRECMSMSSKLSGCGSWRKGAKLSDEHKAKLSVLNSGERNKFWGKKHSKETRQKMSINHVDVTGDKNPFRIAMQDASFRERYILHKKELHEQRKLLDREWYVQFCDSRSKSVIKTHLSGKCKGYGRGHKCEYVDSIKAGRVWCRSSYEVKFLRVCDESGTVMSCTPCKFAIEYFDENNKLRRYLPDFFINDLIVVEIKAAGMVLSENNKRKFQAAQAYCESQQLQFLVLINPDQFKVTLESKIMKSMQNEIER